MRSGGRVCYEVYELECGTEIGRLVISASGKSFNWWYEYGGVFAEGDECGTSTESLILARHRIEILAAM